MSVRYRDAGVDLEAADQVGEAIATRLGHRLFGGLVPVPQLREYRSPVLVSSIDGIGTKVRLAARLGRVGGLGYDIVHHCVNDIAVQGADPLFFLDYLAFHRLDPALVETIVDGIAQACAELSVVLAGGETAEMPLVYPPGELDIAGAVVGAVEADAVIDGASIRAGDVLLGIASSGLHTNGYSLVQHLMGDEEYGRYEPLLGSTLGEALLRPHRSYLREIRRLLSTGLVHGLAHITGGGIAGNLSRIMPPSLSAAIELPDPPEIFELLTRRGVSIDEMRRVFNLGIGLIAVCDAAILTTPGLLAAGDTYVLGTIESSGHDAERSVIFRDCR